MSHTIICISILIGAMAIRIPAQTAAPAAQTSAADSPVLQFEVASVKPNRSGDRRRLLNLQPGGRFTASNISAHDLIARAYRVQGFQVVGGPSWIESENFDVNAKADGDPGDDEISAMLRSLLADRFKLRAHHETREMPIYALLPAHADGHLGEKLKPSSLDCAQAAANRGRGGPSPQPGAPGQCGGRMIPGRLIAGGMSIDDLARTLSLFTGRVVTNKTTLSGTYDFELSWMPEQGPGGPGGGPGGVPGGGASTAPDQSGPSLFTAIQEQLGLKLDAQRGPVDVLVIDSISMPEPD